VYGIRRIYGGLTTCQKSAAMSSSPERVTDAIYRDETTAVGPATSLKQICLRAPKKALAMIALAAALTNISRADIPIIGYLYTESAGQCLFPCTSCYSSYDGVIWDQVDVSVGHGYAPGLYGVRLLYYNGGGLPGYTGSIDVRVAADGTYTVGPEFTWPALDGSYSRYYEAWEANGGPNGNFSVDGDLMYFAGSVCGGAGQLYHGAVDIQIGTPIGRNIKKNDEKRGGDQCSSPSGESPEDAPAMASYSAHAMMASLNIEDTPLRYSPPRGPAINFTVTYNQRDNPPPRNFAYCNLGPRWTFNWFSYVQDDPNNASADTTVFVPGGGTEVYSGFDPDKQSYGSDLQSQAILIRTSATSYEKKFSDGSKQIYSQSDGSSSYPRKIFMTQWIDPVGNAVTIGYDASFRVTSITDALGQVTTLSYELSGDPLKITKVTEPFPTGRYAAFAYTANGQLASITDEIGIQSIFTYAHDGSNFVTSLETPYGTSIFSTGQFGSNKWVEMTDPLGGRERVEYRDNAPGIGASDSVAPAGMTNVGLDVANTFYWDKKTLEIYPPVDGVYDYTKARIIHWSKNSDGTLPGVLASEKVPLENRVWYAYAGQSDTNHVGSIANPAKVARVLGDGSTQLWQYEYNNAAGHRTKATDPVGRVMTYVYDSNQIDLLEVRQTTGAANELIRRFTYNAQHERLTDTDAAGQPTTFTYNSYGQMLTRKNAKNETTTFGYGDGSAGHPVGYLTSVTSPPFAGTSAVTTFTYDAANRVRTVTDSDGYTVTTDHDNLDRPLTVTYPDGSFQQLEYSQDFGRGPTTILNLTRSKDRRGLWTTRHYNANRQVDSITDPLNRTTRFGWCTCGSLTSITDPKNQITTLNRDLQGRVYQKLFADNTATNYLYDGQTAANTVGASSRLKSSTDAKSQRTNYSYFPDDNIQQITYTNTSGQPLNPPTPSVSYTYDSHYNRILTMLDGTGTTTYGYNPVASPPALGAGQLASIDGPLTNDTITFSYDQLGRVVNRSINGATNSASWIFDSLGRVSSVANKLGTFNYGYVNVTDRLSAMTYPGASAVYTYFPNGQNKRLQEIKNQTNSNALISQFDYTYDPEGQILGWTKNYPGLSPAPQRFDLGYDNADQLLTAPLKNASTNALIKQYTYGYDLAANRTSELVGTTTTTSMSNNVNEIISQSGATNRTLTYDSNGSLTNDGSTRTFEWDGASRLVAINYTGTNNRTEFSYDGLSRMAKIIEKSRNRITSTRKFVWCGMERCEFRDDKDAVTLFVYPQGQYSGKTAYFYTRDHLGSIREMFNTKGTIVARFDYDPYGRSTAVVSSTLPDFNFARLYCHSAGNLDLAVYRAYDPDLGRWLNRDPMGENGGINLYAYVSNRLATKIDPLGLQSPSPNLPGPVPGPAPTPNRPSGPSCDCPPRQPASPQDNICSSIAYPLNANWCARRCCKQHDDCYKLNNCHEDSWLATRGCYPECDVCNNRAVGCMAVALTVPICWLP
jgi:RHS repeat-associated protein